MSIFEDSSDHATVDLRSLQLLQDAAHKIASMLDLEPLLETIVGEVAKTLGCNRSAVLLRDEVSDELELVAVRGWTIHVHPKGFRFKIGRDGLVGQAANRGETIYVPDVRDSPDYIVSEETTRSEIDIPLRIRGRTIGVFNVQHSEVDAFPESQRKVLEALAGHIAIAVENARLFGHEKLTREKLEKENFEAQRIQAALLPKPRPLIRGFALEGLCVPVRAVGGDWFDYFPISENEWGVVLGDVSGKGTPAALLMAATRSILRQHSVATTSPARTMERLNETLRSDFPEGSFVTLLYGVLDVAARRLTLSNAGHPWPAVSRAGGVCFLETENGLPLGIGPSSFPESTVRVAPGDTVLFYSDGLLEATNSSGEEFGAARLKAILEDGSFSLGRALEIVRSFVSPDSFADDVTLLTIRGQAGGRL
jgi:sigma-B regulation protein RsbU (phosphoserine phosphatase)